MSEKTSVLLSDVTISGNIVEKGTLITDSKIDGDITADQLHTHESAKVTGNISASKVTLACLKVMLTPIRSVSSPLQKLKVY